MPLTDFIKGRTNRIVIGSTAGVGIIVTLLSTFTRPLPAYRIETPDNERVWEVSTYGAIGVGTGSTPFGSNGNCLKSGGSSGTLMSWGTCGAGGTGSDWSNTGSLQGGFDNRYVRKSGSTMTGTLTINLTSGFLGLKVLQAFSGNVIHAEKTLTSSGSLKVLGSISGASLKVGLTDDNAWVGSSSNISTETAFPSCSNGTTEALEYNTSTNSFSCVTITGGTTYTAGRGLGLASTVFTLNGTISGTLLRFNTMSGYTVYAKNTLASSGSLKFLGTATGNVLHIEKNITSSGAIISETAVSGATLKGFGLGSCSSATTSKLLYVAASNTFDCGTDTDTNTTYTFGQNLTTNGTLITLSATVTGTTLKGWSTISGQNLIISSSASISGTLLVKGNISTRGTLSGAGLKIVGGTTNYLLGRYSVGKVNAPIASLDVNGSISGTSLQLSGNENITGTLLVLSNISTRATMSGNILHIQKGITASGGIISESYFSGATLKGFGLGACSTDSTSKLLYDNATNTFSCGTDNNTGGAYFFGQNLTTNGTLITLSATVTGTTLRGWSTISGQNLIVSSSASVSGTLLVKGNASTKGTLSGAGLKIVGGTTNYLLGKYSFGKVDAPKAVLDVNGTMSGGSLQLSGNANFSGTLLVLSNIATRATMTGNILHIQKGITASGGVISETYYSGATLKGFGLGSCNTATTSKVLYNNVSNQFECGTDTDTDTNTTYSAGQGLTTNGTLFTLSTTLTGTTLKKWSTISGSNLIISSSASISGTLLVKGNVSTRGTLSGAGLKIVGGTTNYLLGKYSFGKVDAPKAVLDVNGTMSGGTLQLSGDAGFSGALVVVGNIKNRGTFSGNILHVEKTLTSSGALIWEGAASGSTLNISSSVTFGAIGGCAFLKTATNGALSCGSTLAVAAGGTAQAALPYKSIILGAGGGTPSTTSGSVAKNVNYSTNGINLQTQDYVGTGSVRYTQWSTIMPPTYDGGTMTGAIKFTSTANAGGVRWFIQCTTIGSGGTIDTSWGTARSMTGYITAGNPNKIAETSVSGPITCSGTPRGGSETLFRIYRDPADVADTLQGTGKLINAILRYRTNSYSD